MTDSAPAPRLTPQTAAALAADLRQLPFTHAAIESLLGPVAAAALEREHAEAARAVLADRQRRGDTGPLDAAVSAWLLGDDVSAEALERALPRLGVDGARAAGLVADVGAGEGPERRVRGLVDLSPYDTDVPGHLWVASDQTALQRRGPLPEDYVLGVGRASLTLAGAADRTRADTALDLGTGCGVQTLHLLAHVQHVTATDLSERCLAFTRFNLMLNAETLGLDRQDLGARVELLAGDMLAPVAGRRFDRIVTNPPFVITPRRDPHAPVLTYRDGGREGDRLVAELMAALPEHLTPAGQAVLLANWEIPEGADDPLARPLAWIPETADAWLIQRDRQDPAGYAETWLQDSSLELDPAAYQRAYADYVADFAERGVAGVGFGYVWMRRPALEGAPAVASGRTAPEPSRLRVAETLTQQVDPAIGADWTAAVARRDRLAACDAAQAAGEEGFAGLVLRVPGHVTEERHARFCAEHPEVILARQGGGLRRVATLDTATAGLLSAADGQVPVGALIGAVSGLLELDDQSSARFVQAVRGLYCDGFLEEVTTAG